MQLNLKKLQEEQEKIDPKPITEEEQEHVDYINGRFSAMQSKRSEVD